MEFTEGRQNSERGERVQSETEFTEGRQSSQKGDRVHRGWIEVTEGRGYALLGGRIDRTET